MTTPDWDHDPNLGHSVSLSLLSAWTQFRHTQGLALNARNDLHDLPADLEDRPRVDLKHELLRMVLKGNYIAHDIVQANLAPRDGPRPAVLDIGTGTGSWAISMAREFPHADVVGIDLIDPKPQETVPSNCRFEVDDANLSLAHYANCFDVIHGRLVDIGIHDYPRFLNQVARMLRPGGIVLLVRVFHQLYAENTMPLPVNEEGEPGFTFLQKVFTACYTSIKRRGGAVDAALRYEYWFSQNPNFETHRTVVKDLFIPIGPWSTAGQNERDIQICEMNRMNFLILLRAFRPLILGDGYPEDEVERWINEAENELETLSVRGYSKWRFAWAIRGQNPWEATKA